MLRPKNFLSITLSRKFFVLCYNDYTMTKQKIIAHAFLQSASTFIYVALVAFLLFNGEKFFGKADSSFGAPMAMLLLFILSATITSSLVLGRPIHLYLSGAKKEAFQLLIATLAFLFLLTLVTFATQFFS